MIKTILTMKKLFLYLLIIIITQVAYAQRPSVRVSANNSYPETLSLDDFLYAFDLSEVPTGFLKEAGLERIDFSALDGDINKGYFADIATISLILESIQSMDVSGTRTWSTGNNGVPSSYIPLHLALYEYNSLSDSAYVHNKITFNNNRLYPAANATVNELYDTRKLVTFAPSEIIAEGMSVSFYPILTSNSNISYTGLFIDFDDGAGFRSVSPESAINTSYSTSGRKTLRLKVQTTGGDYYASSYCVIPPLNVTPMSLPTESGIQVDSTTFHGTYYGSNVKAFLSYKISTNPSANHRPLIIVEGFDPHKAGSIISSSNTKNFGLNHLYNSDVHTYVNNNLYDFYYVDWIDCEADIRANAQLLKAIIAEINSTKHDLGCTASNILIAESMGGLITQVALREMEQDNQTHDVEFYFSHDVPYCGVNLPIGLIYAYQSLKSYLLPKISGLFPKITSVCDSIDQYLYSRSVQQMSINYIDASGNLNKSPHDSFMATLRQLGLPKGDSGGHIYNYSVSNGGVCSSYQDSLSVNGNHLLNYYGKVEASGFIGFVLSSEMAGLAGLITNIFNGDFWSHALSFLPGLSKLEYSLTVNPNDGINNTLSSLIGNYSNKVFGFINITQTFLNDTRNIPSGTIALDNANSSKYDMDSFFVKIPISTTHVNSLMFVPTYSSLCYSPGKNTPSRNYLTQPLLTASEFDGYHLPDTSQMHTNNYPWDWMNAQLDVYIDCPDTLRVGDVASLHGVTGPVRWAGSNNCFEISQSTGEITKIFYEGNFDIMGYTYTDSTYISRKKTVHVEPPVWPTVYMKPVLEPNDSFIYLELHSPNSQLDAQLQTYDIYRTWYSKVDVNALQQYYNHPIRFSISGSGINDLPVMYMMQISAILQFPGGNRPQEYVSYTFRNNQRLALVQPTSIAFDDNAVYMTKAGVSGFDVLDYGDSLIVSYDRSLPSHYTDSLVSDNMLFGMDNGFASLVPLNEENDRWEIPLFADNEVLDELEEIMDNLGSNEIGLIKIEMFHENGGDAVQTFHIPIFRINNQN